MIYKISLFSHIAFTPTPGTSASPVTVHSFALEYDLSESDEKGCPLDYHWCYTVPRVQLWQYILASIIITIGFTICNVICYSIFSKKLGDRPQGTMMGIFNSAGSLARAVGPITVGFLYKNWGPRALMLFMLATLLTSILSVVLNYKRLYVEVEDNQQDSDCDDEHAINSGGHQRSDSDVRIAQ